MTTRTLTLHRETLTELTGADLAAVAGGAPPTLNLRECAPSMWYSCINCITHGHC